MGPVPMFSPVYSLDALHGRRLNRPSQLSKINKDIYKAIQGCPVK